MIWNESVNFIYLFTKFHYVCSDSFIATAALKSWKKIYSKGGGMEHVSTNQVRAPLKRETDGCKGKFEDMPQVER